MNPFSKVRVMLSVPPLALPSLSPDLLGFFSLKTLGFKGAITPIDSVEGAETDTVLFDLD